MFFKNYFSGRVATKSKTSEDKPQGLIKGTRKIMKASTKSHSVLTKYFKDTFMYM